jgi:hypothetical protein
MKYHGRLPTTPMSFAKEAGILVLIMPLTLSMKSLIANLEEVTTPSDALTPMETDGTEQQLPSMVSTTVVTSLAQVEKMLVDL